MLTPAALNELEAWDRIERSEQINWREDRDTIVGLLVVIANKLGAELEMETFVKPREPLGGGMMSPQQAVATLRMATGS